MDMTHHVTKQGGTEPAFDNEYWDEHRIGLYVDANTGEPLFTSQDKFDSKSGWPSFTKFVDGASIYEVKDEDRIEVRTSASHLGHVFDDGPNGSLRYCINSAALRFIPFVDLDSSGYKECESCFPYEKAMFAAGCFWCIQYLFDQLPGVVETEVGYTAGHLENPTYEQVCTGETGHAEAIRIIFDPKKISFEDLLKYFWASHNPTQIDRQGHDVGSQYRSGIYYFSEEQNNIAKKSEIEFDSSDVFVDAAVTEIIAARSFYLAEDYHQNYVRKHPGHRCHSFRTFK